MPPRAFSFDLGQALHGVRDGSVTADRAIADVQAMADDLREQQLKAFDDPDSRRWLEGLHQQTLAGLDTLTRDPQPVRVADCGRLIIAVASILSRQSGLYARWRVGMVLMHLDKAALALRAALDTLTGMDEAGHSLRQDLRRLKASALLETGQPDEARTMLHEMLDEARRLGHGYDVASALFLDAKALERQGARVEAVARARESLDARLAVEDARYAYPLESHYELVGTLARSIGRFEEALSSFEEARRLLLAADNRRAAAFILSEIGYTWQRAGDHERAQEFLDEAAAEAEAIGEQTLANRWRGGGWPEYAEQDESSADQLMRSIAMLNEQPPRTADARVLLARAIAQVRDDGHASMEHMLRNAMALTFSREQKFMQAANAQRAAISVAERTGEVASALAYRANLARFLASDGRLQMAFDEVDATLRLAQAVRRGNSSAELRQTIAVHVSSAHELSAFLAARTWVGHDGSTRPSDPDRVLRAAQQTKAVNLTRWLRLRELVEQQPALGEPMAALRLADVRVEAAAEARTGPLRELLRQQNTALARWAESARALGVDPEPAIELTRADINTALPGRTVVDMLSMDEGMAFVVLTPDGDARVHSSVGRRRERAPLIDRWHLVLQRALRHNGTGREQGAAARADQAELDELTRRLDALITTPLATALDGLAGTDIVIFPHREIFQFPFWRLERHLPGASITVLPGAGAASVLARRTRPADGNSIGFGDVTATLRYSARELSTPGFDTTEEPRADQVARHMANRTTIHFAGHGYFDRANPYYSGLVVRTAPAGRDPLTAPDPWKLGHTLLTTAWMLAALDLPACRLCVLSACYSGVPRLHPASEFTSLPASLLVAGSRNVIASLWPAHDAGTALLMELFYDELQRHPAHGSSRALAAARRALAGMPRDEAIDRLGENGAVPRGKQPFAKSPFVDAFQHYGVD